jgi:adenylate kinase
MNRNRILLADISTHEFSSIEDQSKKLMSRRKNKEKDFIAFESEAEKLHKHRQNYRRESAKYAARLQWRLNDSLNS